jgi:hypothetical protein
MVVGRDQRLFAAHEDVLCCSNYFAATLKGQFFETGAKKIKLADECVQALTQNLVLVTDPSVENPKYCPAFSNFSTRVTTILACCITSAVTLGSSRTPRTQKEVAVVLASLQSIFLTRKARSSVTRSSIVLLRSMAWKI